MAYTGAANAPNSQTDKVDSPKDKLVQKMIGSKKKKKKLPFGK